MRELSQSIVRMASFTGKELREVLRRPGVLLSLIVGPFAIMFVFAIRGAGDSLFSGLLAGGATVLLVSRVVAGSFRCGPAEAATLRGHDPDRTFGHTIAATLG